MMIVLVWFFQAQRENIQFSIHVHLCDPYQQMTGDSSVIKYSLKNETEQFLWNSIDTKNVLAFEKDSK